MPYKNLYYNPQTDTAETNKSYPSVVTAINGIGAYTDPASYAKSRGLVWVGVVSTETVKPQPVPFTPAPQ